MAVIETLMPAPHQRASPLGMAPAEIVNAILMSSEVASHGDSFPAVNQRKVWTESCIGEVEKLELARDEESGIFAVL